MTVRHFIYRALVAVAVDLCNGRTSQKCFLCISINFLLLKPVMLQLVLGDLASKLYQLCG